MPNRHISNPHCILRVYYSLHACARFNPPAHIVKVLLELLPESPIFVDCLDRTPLHIAVGTRANFSTIQMLVDAYPKACAILDTDGKTPLHLACDSACTLFMGDEGRERDLPNTDLVSMMIEAWPSAVPWEDNYGTSALEYAILSGAPIEVVRLLQAVTCLQTKKQAQQVRSTNSRRDSQDSYDCQQQHHPAIASEPSEQEPIAVFDRTASTTTSMPARDGHLPSRRRGGILL